MKLSPTQLRVLKDLRQDSVLHYMPYMGRFRENAYWFVSESMRHVRCSTVNRLVKLGLLEVTQKDCFGMDTRARISPRGLSVIGNGK